MCDIKIPINVQSETKMKICMRAAIKVQNNTHILLPHIKSINCMFSGVLCMILLDFCYLIRAGDALRTAGDVEADFLHL